MSKIRRIRNLTNFLILQRLTGFSPPAAPEFDKATLGWFNAALSISKSYLEFGSGGSTLSAARAGVQSVSVESDPYYARVVSGQLTNASKVQFVTPNLGITEAWGTPVFHSPRKGRSYVTSPFELAFAVFPDLILVDGRYRVACVLECARQALLRGCTARVLFDDYADRPHYHIVERLLGAPYRLGRSAVFEVGRQVVAEHEVDPFFSDWR